MKSLKIIGGLVGVIVIVVAALLYYVFTNLNVIIKRAVETVGPEVTQTSVLLKEVDVKPFEGKGELSNFVVGNPAGFDSPYLLKWDTIRLQIDPASVRGEVIVIKDFTISGVDIVAEQKGLGTNLQKLLETLQAGGGQSQGSEGAAEQGPTKEVRLALEKLSFENNKIQFVTEKFGSYTLDLPAFELNNLGSAQQGLTPQELGYAVLEPLIKRAKRQVEEKAKDLAKEELEAKLKEKQAELEAKAKEKEAELKARAEEEEAKLKAREEELKGKLDGKLKGLMGKE